MWNNSSGYNRHKLPTLRSYAEAKHKHETTTPIRGRSTDVRPLGKRRTTWMHITKGENYYAAKLYNTECVIWYENGDIKINSGGWATYTTRDFIACVLPASFRVELLRSEIRIHGYRVPKEQGLLLKPDAANEMGYKVSSPHQEYTYTINRSKKKEVFNRFKDFRDWLKGYLSLREGFMRHSELMSSEQLKVRPFQHMMYRYPWSPELVKDVKQCRLDLIESMTAPDTEEKYATYVKAASAIVAAIGKWHINGRSISMEAFDKMLFKLHAPEILDVKPVPLGTTPARNAYTVWVNGWIKEVYETNNTNN